MGSIEKMGIGYLESCIEYDNFLETFIDTNDKTPSWDGSIFVYSDISRKKEFLNGRVPIQIKSKHVSSLSNRTTSFSFDLSDLRNFLKDGGILLFVVEIFDHNFSIFYKFLYPYDLKTIINQLENSGKSSKTITLAEKGKSDFEFFNIECNNFLLHKQKQISILENPLKIEDAERLNIHVVCQKGKLFDFLLHNEIPLYGIKSQDSIERIVENIQITTISQTIQNPVRINSKIYYETYNLLERKSEKIIEFSKNLSLNIDNKKFQLHLASNLSQQINDLTFIIDLITYKKFSIGEYKIEPFNFIDDENDLLLKTKRLLKHAKEIYSFLALFDINPDLLEIRKITEIQFHILEEIINNVLYNQKPKNINYQIGINTFELGNLILGLFISQNQDNILIYNLFSPTKYVDVKIKCDNGEFVPSSIFTVLNHDFLLSLSNLNLETMNSEIRQINYSKEFGTNVNILGLELLHSYDISNRMEFLNAAQEIFSWLLQNDENDSIYKINWLQTVKRERNFSDKEIFELRKLQKEYKEDNRLLCGINILLENKSEAIYLLNELNAEEKIEFIGFPIYTLGKKLSEFS